MSETFSTQREVFTPQALRCYWAGTVVLTLLLLLVMPQEMNLALFRSGNALSDYTGEWLWSNLTVLGDTLVLFCLVLPFVGRRPTLVWSVVLAVIVVSLMVHGAKLALDMPRPPAILAAEELRLIGFKATSGSFPSGHTAAAFVFAGGLCLLPFSLGTRVMALAMAFLVGLSRVAVGIHWPVDVLGGALIGWLGVGLSVWLALRWPLGLVRRAQRITALLLIIAALLTSALHDGGYPQARPLLVLLPLVTLWLALPALRRLYAGDSRQ